jgi:hypothetical protein
MFYRAARPESGRTRAKGSLGRRSVELRASGAVGWRWQAVFGCQMVWNKSTRRSRGARRGAGRQAQMAGILTITGGSSIPVLSLSKGQR